MQDSTFDISSVSISNASKDSGENIAAQRAAAAGAAAAKRASLNYALRKRAEFAKRFMKPGSAEPNVVDVTEYAKVSNQFWTRNRLLFAGGALVAVAAYLYFRRSK